MNRLKELRKKKGITLDDVEEKTGIKRSTFNRYENGESEPKLETWKKLADYFGVGISYIQGISDVSSISYTFDDYDSGRISEYEYQESINNESKEKNAVNFDYLLNSIDDEYLTMDIDKAYNLVMDDKARLMWSINSIFKAEADMMTIESNLMDAKVKEKLLGNMYHLGIRLEAIAQHLKYLEYTNDENTNNVELIRVMNDATQRVIEEAALKLAKIDQLNFENLGFVSRDKIK